jgi:glycosyltransferase involved in cell wall biosynthesis
MIGISALSFIGQNDICGGSVSSDLKPKISIVLPAMLGYKTVLSALDSWEAQTCRDRLELLILCPDDLVTAAAQAAALRLGQVLVPVGSAQLHEARAIGVQKASADYVMLAEDHCLPDPDWAEHMLDRIAECWDGIACALRPGNRTSCWARGSFLVGYGQWFMPAAGGPTQILCGLNGVVRTKLLRQLGP